MKIGIRAPSPDPTMPIDPGLMARKAEELGFESLWFPEHPIVPVNANAALFREQRYNPGALSRFPDPFISLAFAAATTSRLRIGTGVCLLPERNPLLLAKEAATLDLYSKGRLLLGIGAGWIREETEIMGGNFHRRWTQSREAVLALKALWTQERAEYHGEFYDFPPVWSYPKPASRPHPPILIGSVGPSAIRWVVEWGDEWMPIDISPAQLESGRRELERRAADAGRDMATLGITLYAAEPTRASVRAFFDAGADRVVVRRATNTADDAAVLEDLERMAAILLV